MDTPAVQVTLIINRYFYHKSPQTLPAQCPARYPILAAATTRNRARPPSRHSIFDHHPHGGIDTLAECSLFMEVMATGNILAVVASGPWGYFRADPIRFSLGFLVLASPFASILLTYRRCARPFPFFSGPFFLALFPIFFTEVHLLMDLHRFIEIEDLTDLAYVTARLHGFIGEGLGGFIVSGIAILFYSALYFAARRSVITTNPPSGSASEDVADGS